MSTVINIDQLILKYLTNSPLIGSWWLEKMWVILAIGLVYLVPLILIAGWFWSAQTKRVVFKAGLAGLLAWLVISKTISYFVHRPRPIDAVIGVKELIFERSDFSFPSDHAAAIFAVALTIRLCGHRKLGNYLLVIGVIMSFARIMVGVHFPLDIIAGVGIGCLTALIIWRFQKFIDRHLTEPFIGLMQKLHL